MLLSSLGLTALLLLGLRLSFGPTTGSLTRVTIASDPGRDSFFPSLSADGSKVAFESDADFLGQGIPANQSEIWLYDTTTLTLTRITTVSASDRDSSDPSLSADGTQVAFSSNADFLGQGIPASQSEIWLYDTTTLTLTRLTTASASDRESLFPSLSGDGSKVAFESDADFLGQGILPSQFEIWLLDTQTLTFTRITTVADVDRSSAFPSLNADGSRVAFSSDADFLGQGIPPGQFEIWLYDTTAQTLTRLTHAAANGRISLDPRLSPDGTKVAFSSDADFLGQGIPPGQSEIWLYDTTAQTLTRLTHASEGNRDSFNPSLNADGTKVAFYSDADFLGQGIPDSQFEIWLYDTTALTLTRLTTASASDRGSFNPNVSPNGARVAFYSDADFLGQGIPDSQFEIWRFDDFLTVYLPLIVKN